MFVLLLEFGQKIMASLTAGDGSVAFFTVLSTLGAFAAAGGTRLVPDLAAPEQD